MATGDNGGEQLAALFESEEAGLLEEWSQELLGTPNAAGAGKFREAEVRDSCAEFLRLSREALRQTGADTNVQVPAWAGTRRMLAELSRLRGQRGFSPSETASFVFSLKRPLFRRLSARFGKDAEGLSQEIWIATELLDALGLYTTEVHQKTREEVIARQQQEMLELSTPVVKLWDGILALPMIGTLDSSRSQVVMESLLQKIVETGCTVAIIDITGVPTVDTLTAQHLLKTVTAAKLMGAECIISGIRPQIAQTIVHLGVDLGAVVTKANMADAFALALKRTARLRPSSPSRPEPGA